MKRKLLLLITLLLLIVLTGCGGTAETEETPSEETEQTEEEVQSSQNTQPTQFDNLQIGQTADFPNYSITINSVGPSGTDSIVANLTMVAKQDSKFKNKYVNAYVGDEEYSEASGGDNHTVAAGETYTTDLTFFNKGDNGIMWDNWGNEAMWRFEPIVNPPAPDPNTTYDGAAAIEALKDYGDSVYPYGFKLHDFAGVLRNSEVDPTTHEYAIYCDVTNEYGAEAKDLTCFATVTGVGTNSSNYTVTDFSVE